MTLVNDSQMFKLRCPEWKLAKDIRRLPFSEGIKCYIITYIYTVLESTTVYTLYTGLPANLKTLLYLDLQQNAIFCHHMKTQHGNPPQREASRVRNLSRKIFKERPSPKAHHSNPPQRKASWVWILSNFFFSQINFQRHITAIHLKEKPHQCEICQIDFQIHTQEAFLSGGLQFCAFGDCLSLKIYFGKAPTHEASLSGGLPWCALDALEFSEQKFLNERTNLLPKKNFSK